jgi:hypothetical protein
MKLHGSCSIPVDLYGLLGFGFVLLLGLAKAYF